MPAESATFERFFALLEKMGWKKGQGLGREGQGREVPVEAHIKTDMGGLRVDGEELTAQLAMKLVETYYAEWAGEAFEMDSARIRLDTGARSTNGQSVTVLYKVRETETGALWPEV